MENHGIHSDFNACQYREICRLLLVSLKELLSEEFAKGTVGLRNAVRDRARHIIEKAEEPFVQS